MKQARALVRRWAIIAAVTGSLAGAGCEGVGTMGGFPSCEEALIDPELEGCFRHPDDSEMGEIEIIQYDCNLLTGSGEGLRDLLGTGIDESWNLYGVVEAEGYARLVVHALVDAESISMEAFREVSDTGEAVLTLRRPEILGSVVELISIPCP